jgi:dienelactone hydrolase
LNTIQNHKKCIMSGNKRLSKMPPLISMLRLIFLFAIMSLFLTISSDCAVKCVEAAQRVQSSYVEVTFSSVKDEKQLSGLLYRPAGTGPFPAVVLLHGSGGIKFPWKRHNWWAETFQSWGYVALLIDSIGPRGADGNILRFLRKNPLVRIYDTHSGLKYLQNQNYVDGDSIGVMGWSHGGTTVLSVVDPMLGGTLGMPHGTFRAAVAFYPGCGGMSFNTPLLILVGDKDDWTPAQPCIDMVSNLSEESAPVILKVYPGAYHIFDGFEPIHVKKGHTVGRNSAAAEKAVEEVKRFFDQHLGMK